MHTRLSTLFFFLQHVWLVAGVAIGFVWNFKAPIIKDVFVPEHSANMRSQSRSVCASLLEFWKIAGSFFLDFDVEI